MATVTSGATHLYRKFPIEKEKNGFVNFSSTIFFLAGLMLMSYSIIENKLHKYLNKISSLPVYIAPYHLTHYNYLKFYGRESDNEEVRYYSSKAHFDELIEYLEDDGQERRLLSTFKNKYNTIIKHMAITDSLVEASRGMY